jgi:hypothetical protein
MPVTKEISNEADGDCFVVVGHAAMDKEEQILICHGKVMRRQDGMIHTHAWIEKNGNVIDKSNGLDIEMPVKFYYALGNIDREKVRKYTPRNACELMVSTGHYGPWNKEDQ